MRRLPLLTLILTACTTPPAPSVPHPEPTAVAASFNKTWDAVIDRFAERNIPIKTIDKSSGIIVAERLGVGTDLGDVADCGTDMGRKLYPTSATFNVLVRGDSTKSTVRVTVRWVRTGMARGLSTETVSEECGSTGAWETEFEGSIKTAAEAKQ